MSETNYAGIDYGRGISNVSESGIRYGVISQHSVDLNASDCIWSNGRDLSYEAFLDEVKAKLRSALDDYFSGDALTSAVDDAFEAVSDNLGDDYHADSSRMLYEQDGYKITTSETELWVLNSPFYTFAQFCSPCAPGAGNLDSPCSDGPKTFCLGPDWFDDNKAPYPVYSVKDNTLVNP
jgi:hypothetical protein